MKRWQSGLLLIGVGAVLNILGRVLSPTAEEQTSLLLAGTLFFLMLGSVVIVLFGLFRLIAGLITKS